MNEFEIKKDKRFKYVEEGEGETLVLLHGLFGALSNFQDLISEFSKGYKVVVPLLPIFELPLPRASLKGLVGHVERFVAHMGYEHVTVLGNSLGGHIALLYALQNPKNVRSIILTGSSGLFENSLGDTFPRRGNYEYIKQKTELTFFDPKTASKELIDEVYNTVNDRGKALRIIATAKSAIRNNLADKLQEIYHPALLIWGKNDTITPPFVGAEFKALLQNGRLELIDKCGHAPMMERPKEFNALLSGFLEEIYATA